MHINLKKKKRKRAQRDRIPLDKEEAWFKKRLFQTVGQSGTEANISLSFSYSCQFLYIFPFMYLKPCAYNIP